MQQETIDKDTLRTLHQVRGFIYNFLHKSYIKIPDAEYLNELLSILPELIEFSKESENSDMIEGIKSIEDLFNERSKLSGKELEEFELEILRKYTTIFCINKSVSAEESYYTSNDKLVRQESYDLMRDLFRKYDIKLNENIYESEEHVSIELAFMSKLSFLLVGYLDSSDKESYNSVLQEQLLFHSDHFDKWFYEFCDNVINYNISDERLFKNLSRFLLGFISEDKVLLNELVDKKNI